MSNTVFWKNKKIISKFHLLKISPSELSITDISSISCFYILPRSIRLETTDSISNAKYVYNYIIGMNLISMDFIDA